MFPGFVVSGTGVAAGERFRPDGTRTSALRFHSPHPLSLPAEGRGYWRYLPTEGGAGAPGGASNGVRFLTGYDYRPRWGRFGRIADRAVLRPLMGWATAWSFDRLRLWCERGASPERTRWYALAELAARSAAVAGAAGWAAYAPWAGALPVAVLVAFAALLLPPASRSRRFDATMIYSAERGCVVDYLGTHQHLASDLHLSAEDGALVLRSGEHRFREGPVDFRVPELLGGAAEVRESYDEVAGCFRIDVRVTNSRLGPLFGYQGAFQAEFVPVAECGMRDGLRPVREEARV